MSKFRKHQRDDAEMDKFYDKLLWNVLKDHIGHRVEIALYGDPEDPDSITLEDLDTSSIILDAGIYTVCAREDV